MATKPKSKAKPKRAVRLARPGGKRHQGGAYEVVLREGSGIALTVSVEDRQLYPRAVAWNRLLLSDRGRQPDKDKEAKAWRARGLEELLHLAGAGEARQQAASEFIEAAATSGVVQVEMVWQREDTGWAARVFPWEALLGLATKELRQRLGQKDFAVVRVLAGGARPTLATGTPGFAVSASAEAAGFDTRTERAAINAALQSSLQTLSAKSLEELAREVTSKQPRIVHLVLNSAEQSMSISVKDQDQSHEQLTTQLAQALGSRGAEIVVFSACYTGRRLAPLAVAYGAKIAIGFHGDVMDASLPVFFGAFYRAWHQQPDALGALRAGLAANKSQSDPGDLGTVTLWSAESLIVRAAKRTASAKTVAKSHGTGDGGAIPPAEVKAALPVSCELETGLNYSVLHNSRGGLFKGFAITKIKEGSMEPLEVTVRLDTGLDRPAECHFFVDLPVEADRQKDLASLVSLPLGAQLLRQRGESLQATVEIAIKCGQVPVFHTSRSIKLLPCDEWRDDASGRRFLPSFVFPRDPAVREILSAAQPFLRALCDQTTAGFDGYQGGFTASASDAVALQTRAIWAALQHTTRLDYVNPPPAYTQASQRLRTPEEILRARRGTCIELALLLASCWEHVGIFPVLFLTSGHAFAGYWTNEAARSGFIEGLSKLLDHPRSASDVAGAQGFGGTSSTTGQGQQPWLFAELHHLAAIREQVDEGLLVPVEATFIPLQRSFADAVNESRRLLAELRGSEEFDGMIDVQTARERGVTPLAIITQGTAA